MLGWEEEGGGRGSRRSKDKEGNGDGRDCVGTWRKGTEYTKWGVEGDEQGEWTFTGGRANSVIDYAMGNEDTWEKVERVEVGERVESDHHPVVVWLRGEGGGEVERREGSGRRGGGRGNWTERGERSLWKALEEGRGGEWVKEEWRELGERIKGAMEKSEEGERGKGREDGGMRGVERRRAR